MAIICGTDFSTPAHGAATAAGELARRLGDSVELVHVLTGLGDELLLGSDQDHLLIPTRQKLKAEADRLRAMGVEVTETLLAGLADEVLVDRAKQTRARMIVIGSLGKRPAARWFLGSTAERTAQTSPLPVLVFRGEDGVAAWLEKGRPLRVTLGTDFTAATEAAVRWLVELSAAGPIEVDVAHVVWPPETHQRYGLRGPLDLVELHPQARELLLRELKERLAPLEERTPVRYHLDPGLGRPADHLIQLAQRQKADLLVVGTRQRKGLDRVRHGSVSFGVLQRAPMAVVVIPHAEERDLGPLPEIRRVLAPTDLSELGDLATRMAFASLPNGGVVRLLHVVERPATNPAYANVSGARGEKPGNWAEEKQAISERARGLIPEEAEELGIVTEVEIVESNDVATAICQAAERLRADLICLGTKGRTGLSQAVLGSVAQAVLGGSKRPVLLVKPQKS